jgi:hypothetical protein
MTFAIGVILGAALVILAATVAMSGLCSREEEEQ